MILVFPFGIIEFSTQRKFNFLTLFHFLTRLLNSNHLQIFSTFIVGEMELCEKRAFQLLQMRKTKISLNIKTKSITNFLLTVKSSKMKDYTCHYEVRT